MKEQTTPQPPDMLNIITGWAKMRGTSLRKLSLKMHRNENYLQQILSKGEVKASVLLTLSDVLHVNLFEYYLDQLPESKRITQREKMMKEKITALEKELETVKAERDKYWSAISKH
jgi:lambda repressor-like predicted transcriptional regulator